jgi:predicted  nucleic acid-binding Zn-ribbon protein
MTAEIDAMRHEMAELGHRVERLETRGSDTAVRSLQMLESLMGNFEDLKGRITMVIQKVDQVMEEGCTLGAVHETQMHDLRRELDANSERIDAVGRIAAEAKEASNKAMYLQTLVITVGTTLLVGLVNFFFVHLNRP